MFHSDIEDSDPFNYVSRLDAERDAAEDEACAIHQHHTPQEPAMTVIVVRRAYCDTPDKVIAYNGSSYADREAAILKHYPSAQNIKMGEFDVTDEEDSGYAAGYLFDVLSVIN